MNHPPEPPAIALFGLERATRLGDLFVREGVSVQLTSTTVAVFDGRVVGFVDCGSQYGVRLTAGRLLRLLPQILVILGQAAPRAFYGIWLRQKVQFERLAGAFPIAELHVEERLRNKGIGSFLLQHAERLASAANSQRMCLETGITNPARRLYERHGYTVIATKADARYERLTGSPGRVLMAKDLRAVAP